MKHDVPSSTLEKVLRHLQGLVEEGLRHGFFDLSVTGEIIDGKKRRVTIKAGKSFRHVIPVEELDR